MATYEFTIKVVGEGDTPSEAWQDAVDSSRIIEQGAALDSDDIPEFIIISE